MRNPFSISEPREPAYLAASKGMIFRPRLGDNGVWQLQLGFVADALVAGYRHFLFTVYISVFPFDNLRFAQGFFGIGKHHVD